MLGLPLNKICGGSSHSKPHLLRHTRNSRGIYLLSAIVAFRNTSKLRTLHTFPGVQMHLKICAETNAKS